MWKVRYFEDHVSPVFENRMVEKGEGTLLGCPFRLVSCNYIDSSTQPTSRHLYSLALTLALSLFSTSSGLTTMRSPAIVLSVVAVSALSPTILGSPLPPHSAVASFVEHRRSDTGIAARGLGFLNDIFSRADTPKTASSSRPKIASVANIPVGYITPSNLSLLSSLIVLLVVVSSGGKTSTQRSLLRFCELSDCLLDAPY